MALAATRVCRCGVDVPFVICVEVDVICECAGESRRPGWLLIAILVRPSTREREPDNPPPTSRLVPGGILVDFDLSYQNHIIR